ncbi:energy-coupling factor ABC transporter ATP-binding protein [bacterium]|nr:energy-coupling factor ABC transporter ATP-binding protein [bacterium]
MEKSECLDFDKIGYRYPGGNRNVLSEITCSLNRSEITALVGLSASGKSTFGRIIKGLIEPDRGCCNSVNSDGERNKLPAEKRMKMIGWTGAHPELQLFAATVQEEVGFGPVNLGVKGRDLDQRINWALEKVGLDPEEFLNRDPFRLSGGEKRRIALAGIIAMQTDYYIFDEPTAGLDDDGLESFIDLIKSLKNDGCGILWITHNISQLAGIVDRLWSFEDGELVMNMAENQVDWEDLTERLVSGNDKCSRTSILACH